MTDSERPPKFEYMARPKVYGVLDASHELLICVVRDKRLVEQSRPISWEAGVLTVKTAESYNKLVEKHRLQQEECALLEPKVAAWRTAHKEWRDRHNIPPESLYTRGTQVYVGQQQWRAYDEARAAASLIEAEPKEPERARILRMPREDPPLKQLMVGLNDDRSAYEIVYDPHGLEADIDPMMLLNFRRKTRA